MLVSLIYFIAILILLGLVFWVMGQLGLPEPIKKAITIAIVVLVVIAVVIWMVQWAWAGAQLPSFPHR